MLKYEAISERMSVVSISSRCSAVVRSVDICAESATTSSSNEVPSPAKLLSRLGTGMTETWPTRGSSADTCRPSRRPLAPKNEVKNLPCAGPFGEEVDPTGEPETGRRSCEPEDAEAFRWWCSEAIPSCFALVRPSSRRSSISLVSMELVS
ncbi:hypothetical protein GGI06_003000 [Coemansia sp. S85]|nr:hypothetical protein GGI06_003000 [Coemansia sp. S85]